MTTRPEATALAAFTDELRHSLPMILTALDAVDRDRADRSATHEAYRLIHALKGAASMVGLAAFGHLLNVAEEMLEAPTGGGTPLTDEALGILRASVPQFADYMDAALGGRPIEPIALALARALRQDSEADMASIGALLDIETREVALSQPEPVEPEHRAAAQLAVAMSGPGA